MQTLDITLSNLKDKEEIFWINPNKMDTKKAFEELKLSHPSLPTLEDIKEADLLLKRFGPFFKKVFPEIQNPQGLVESALRPIFGFQNAIIPFVGGRVLGDWLLKCDHDLPISGSIKARGGVFEVVKLAEKLAISAGILSKNDPYDLFANESFKHFFSHHTLVVGSTGNLGLSIGTIGRSLGFNVIVHMSSDAKEWKIQRLKTMGVEVILHEADYSIAVEKGRIQAMNNPNAHFIDDENSLDLFTGYAVAALRLKEDFENRHISIDEDHPLFVYLPCGVGGAPGGIAYGLKQLFGNNVYIFLAEPIESPCMLLGMHTKKFNTIAVQDIGLKNQTIADGLAVGRASGFVGEVLSPLIDGIYTVSDEKLLWMLYILSQSDQIHLEPSALAGLIGPVKLFYDSNGFDTLIQNTLLEKMASSTHVSWATGGSLVPEAIQNEDIKKGQAIRLSSL